MPKTITFDEKNNGWTSFWTYYPEWMTRLGNDFYSFKNGQLFRHHSETAPKNLFYDEDGNLTTPSASSVTLVFNQNPSDVKHFKSISLESNSGDWDVSINTNLDSGHVNDSHFEKKEGEFYSYIRRNSSDDLNVDHLSIQGIGVPLLITGNTYTFDSVPNFLSEEDYLCYYNSSLGTKNKMAKVISFNGNTITTQPKPVGMTIPNGSFMFVAKNSEAESFGIKGFEATVKLTTTNLGDAQDLYCVNSEVFKSYQ